MDPTLLDQLAQAGLAPEHLKLLAPLLEQGQNMMQPQTAQGRQVGNTYVAASPLEHAANAIRQMVGAKMVRDATAKQQAIVGQQGQARQAYLQALQTAQQGGQGAPDMLSRPPDPQAAQGLEMAGVASGDPVLRQSAEFGMQREQLGRQNRILENTLRHQQVLEQQGQERVGQGQQRVDLGGARLDAINKRLALQGVRYNPNSGQFENIAPLARGPGAQTPAPAPSSDAIPPPAPLGKWQDKALKDLGNDFNPSGGHAGEFGKNQARVNAASRIMALAVDEKGQPRDLNPQQMPELAQSVASLISAGSSPAQSQIEHLLPKSYSRDAAGILQYLTNEPHGAGQQAFVQNMVETAQRERDVAQKGIEQVRGQLGAKHQRILRSNPEESRKVLQGFGWDLGPDGVPVMQAAPAPATAALRKKYGL